MQRCSIQGWIADSTPRPGDGGWWMMAVMQPADTQQSEKPPAVEGYELLEKLGQGGMSSVWKARQVLLGRTVVIKVLSEKMTHNPDDIRYFKREALIAANLKHPGIVQVYDFGQFKDAPGYYFIMEYVSGYTVGAWLRRKGRLDEADVLVLAHSVAEALRYAWEQARVIHCDIKPDNIMVDGDGTIKLTDLGVAQAVSTIHVPAPAAADVGYIMGTPNYMAPEQVRGDKNLDCRVDIYGLGATLHHLLTGLLPFGNGDPQGIMERQIREPFDDPRKLNPAVSAGFAGLVMKMLAKHPAARYQNWGEVLGDIVRQEQLARRRTAKPDGLARTIPLRIGQELQATPSTPAQGKPAAAASAPADDFRPCPYCAEPIRKQAVYCRFCGKQVPRAGAAAAAPERKTRRRVRPPAKVAAPAPAPILAPRVSLKLEEEITFWGYLRILLSLGFLAFLGYYAYQRFVNHKNILTQVHMAIRQGFQPDAARRGPREPLDGERRAAPESQEAAGRNPWDRLQTLGIVEDNRDGSPENGRRRTRIFEPAPGIDTAPAADDAELEIMRTDKYQQLLRKCEQLRPALGSSVMIHLNPPAAPLRGILVDYRDDHLLLQLPSGTVKVRYRDMEPSASKFYCASEHALELYRQQDR